MDLEHQSNTYEKNLLTDRCENMNEKEKKWYLNKPNDCSLRMPVLGSAPFFVLYASLNKILEL